MALYRIASVVPVRSVVRCTVPGWLVLSALAVNLGLYAVMMFGTLAQVSALADGVTPFDLRPFGYTLGEARELLELLGEEGRNYYSRVHLAVDAVYPATYAVSRALALWWLTTPRRLCDRILPMRMRVGLLVPPVVAGGLDYLENWHIAAMLDAGPRLTAELVDAASMATIGKLHAGLLTEVVLVVLASAVFVCWRRRAAARTI